MRGNNSGTIIMFLYLLLGVYLINIPFVFVEIPEIILTIEKWIFLVAGVFLVWGAINFRRASNINKYYRS